MTDDRLLLTAQQAAEILDAYNIPQSLRDAWNGLKGADDERVHWRGLDSQETFVPAPVGIVRPTRCGLFGSARMLGYPLEHVTCPECRQLAEADAADV